MNPLGPTVLRFLPETAIALRGSALPHSFTIPTRYHYCSMGFLMPLGFTVPPRNRYRSSGFGFASQFYDSSIPQFHILQLATTTIITIFAAPNRTLDQWKKLQHTLQKIR